jgi:hypothetical protein
MLLKEVVETGELPVRTSISFGQLGLFFSTPQMRPSHWKLSHLHGQHHNIG